MKKSAFILGCAFFLAFQLSQFASTNRITRHLNPANHSADPRHSIQKWIVKTHAEPKLSSEQTTCVEDFLWPIEEGAASVQKANLYEGEDSRQVLSYHETKLSHTLSDSSLDWTAP